MLLFKGNFQVYYKVEPNGALSNYCEQAGCPGGNKDSFKTTANRVWFPAEAFANGNGMTLEDVEKLFAE